MLLLRLFIIKYMFSRWMQQRGVFCRLELCDIFLNLCNLLLNI